MVKENQKIGYKFKVLIVVTFTLFSVVIAQAQIITTSNASSLTIRSGTTFSAGGLTLVPADHFTIKDGNGITRDTMVAHPASKALIDRAYLFTKAIADYKGEVHFNYHDSELNGLDESGLELHIHDGVNWKPHTVLKHDHQQNIHSTALSGITILKLTLVDRKSLIGKREPLPIHLLTNPVIAGQLNLLVEKDCDVVLLNSMGQILEQKTLSRGWHTLDIANYPKGIYYIRDAKGVYFAIPLILQ